MKKPLIGIIGKADPKFGDDLWNRVRVADELRYLVIKNGGIAICLLPTNCDMSFKKCDFFDHDKLTRDEIRKLKRQINLCDGFILQGGLASSAYEVEMAKIIIKKNKPLIGICAGFNNILRALGSNVINDKTNLHNVYDVKYRHDIDIVSGTIMHEILKSDKYRVNSIHSRVATRGMVAPYAKISSVSDDGLVESFELPNKKFVLGIKWHPELMMDEEYVDRLFRRFIAKC